MRYRVVAFVALFSVVLMTEVQPTQAQLPVAAQDLLLPAALLPQTKIEALLATPGVLLVQDFYRVGTRIEFPATVDAMVVTELGGAKQHLLGLRIAMRDTAKPTRLQTSLLDFDEAVRLSEALGTMSELALKWLGAGQESRFTETQFSSAGGFRIGFRQDWRNQEAFMSSGFVDVVRVPIEMTDFKSAKMLVDQALVLLHGK
jgi:hypothetical protein